ncbi:uncharacterized protein ACB057_006796 [Neosynchiropus ocellatus]
MNSTFYFSLSGFGVMANFRAVFLSLTLLCYLAILVVNVSMILTIVLDSSLHEPMYIIVCNLSVSALWGTAGFYPKFIMDLLSCVQVISYVGCYVQVFIIYSYVMSDYSVLALMAYDRYVAICQPLEYHSIMSVQRTARLVALAWCVPLSWTAVLIYMSIRLKLCGNQIQKLYCENWSIVKLSCTETTANNIVGLTIISFYIVHALAILVSYVRLVTTALKTKEGRRKFSQTCVPHLLCLLNVTATLLFDVMHTRYGSASVQQSLKNFMALQFLVIPPLVNPIIYGLILTKIRYRMVALCFKRTGLSRAPLIIEGVDKTRLESSDATDIVRSLGEYDQTRGCEVPLRKVGDAVSSFQHSPSRCWPWKCLRRMGQHSLDIYFNLTMFVDIGHYRYAAFAFFLLLYSFIVFSNIILILVICRERTLHQPMYVLVACLSVNELYGSAGFFPRFLMDLLSDSHLISYTSCYAQIYFIYSYASSELAILSIMAYDRYIAVCQPLHYKIKMTAGRVVGMVGLAQLYSFFNLIVCIGMSSRLPLCGTDIQKIYCAHWNIVKLSCVPTVANNIVGLLVTVAGVFLPLFFVLYTYLRILLICWGRSADFRGKAFQQCLPHIVSFVIFSIAVFCDISLSRFSPEEINPIAAAVLALEFVVIPPLLNPLIYGMKSLEIRRRLPEDKSLRSWVTWFYCDTELTSSVLLRQTTAVMDNASSVTMFTLSGLSGTNNRILLFVLTLLCYCAIWLVNLTIIMTILLEKRLHEPMYIFLCNLCINGLYGTAGFYPKFLYDLLSKNNVISYSGCLLQGFVLHCSACVDFSILAVMAYDRYVAICRPLVYHSVMTRMTTSVLTFLTWLVPSFLIFMSTLTTSRYRMCGSHIPKIYCVNYLISRLSCSTSIANIIIPAFNYTFYVGHNIFICWSYMYIFRICRASAENWNKFLQTCVPHLFSLAVVFGSLFFDLLYMRFGSKSISQAAKNFIAIEFILIPPIFNPIMYGLKLTEVRKSIQKFLCRGKFCGSR